MGVRFSTQQPQRPDLSEMQQAAALERRAAEQGAQRPGGAEIRQTQVPEEAAAVREPAEPNRPEQQNTVERAAGDAGTQTPGSIIDMLA